MNTSPAHPVADAVRQRLDTLEERLPALEDELIRLQSGSLDIRTKSNDFDLVTEADLTAERNLVAHIRDRFPDDAILSEEGAGSDPPADTHAFHWILDPIDGTANYANRLPLWAIAIALWHCGQVVGALVRGPALGLRYRAERGCGATLDGAPIRVNGKSRIADGIVATGFPYDRARHAEPLARTLANVIRTAGGVRRLGSAALDFCFVADGRITGFYEMGLMPWDIAAGGLVAEEAGARLTDIDGRPVDLFHNRGIVAAPPAVHDELRRIVRPLREAIDSA